MKHGAAGMSRHRGGVEAVVLPDSECRPARLEQLRV